MTRGPRLLAATLIAALVALVGAPAWAQRTDQLKRELEGVEVVERLGQPAASDAAFGDEQGRAITLASFAGKPTLLSFNYTSCPVLCSLQLAGMAKVLKGLGQHGDGRFEVVTVLIDPKETVDKARAAQETYLRQAGGARGAGWGWHFFTGGEEQIARLADSVGFHFRYDPEKKEFRHQATLIVLTADGRVSSYLHGISYRVADLDQALRRAFRGEVIAAEEQKGLGGFLLSCFSFDAADNTPLALRIMRAGGIVILALLAVLLGVYGRRDLRRKKAP